jgi:hypothetical protein
MSAKRCGRSWLHKVGTLLKTPARPPGIHHSISRMHFVQPGQKLQYLRFSRAYYVPLAVLLFKVATFNTSSKMSNKAKFLMSSWIHFQGILHPIQKLAVTVWKLLDKSSWSGIAPMTLSNSYKKSLDLQRIYIFLLLIPKQHWKHIHF